MLFFSEFSIPGRIWTEFRTKIYCNFFNLSHPVLAKNNARKIFFSFLNFFAIFFRIFLPSSSMNRSRDENFFHSFSAYLIPIWLKRRLERGFLIFWIFLLFFSQFSSLAKFERNSGLNFFSPFFGLSQPILAKNNAGKRFFNFFNFFDIFSRIFLPGSSMNGIRDKNFFSLSRPISSCFG